MTYALKPETSGDVMQRHTFVEDLHAERVAFSDEVEKVLKGDYRVPHDDAASAGYSTAAGYGSGHLEVQRPSAPLNRYRKMVSMLGVRSRLGIEVPTVSDNPPRREEQMVEHLENGVHQYIWTMNQERNSNIMRDYTAWAALRGVAYMTSSFMPQKPDKNGLYARFPIQSSLPDPNTLFVYRGHNGAPAWYTRKVRMPVIRLQDWMGRTNVKLTEYVSFDDVIKRYAKKGQEEGSFDLGTEVEVIEYVDSRWRAFVIQGEAWTGPLEHGYGFLPLAEMRFDELPVDDERWRSLPFLGRVLDDIKGETILMGRLASAVNSIFWPLLTYMSESGGPAFASPQKPGTWVEAQPDAKLEIMNPQVNAEVLQILQAFYKSNVSQGTVPDIAFLENLPDRISGFGINQVLGVMMDQTEDLVQSIERAAGVWLGNTLRLMEHHADVMTADVQDADDFEEGVFILPGYKSRESRSGMRSHALKISADDIQGHHHVVVSVKPQLPKDDVQTMTLIRQARGEGLEGGQVLGLRTTLEKFGDFENVDEVIQELNDEKLLMEDPMVRQANNTIMQADWLKRNRKSLVAAERVVARENEKLETAREKIAEDVDDGSVHATEEQKFDRSWWLQGVAALDAGEDPADVLADVTDGVEEGVPVPPPAVDPLAVPPGAAPGGEAGGQGQLLTAQEGGLPTGIQGLDNRAQSPEQMTTQRSAVDGPNVRVERIMETLRRAGKPGPR